MKKISGKDESYRLPVKSVLKTIIEFTEVFCRHGCSFTSGWHKLGLG